MQRNKNDSRGFECPDCGQEYGLLSKAPSRPVTPVEASNNGMRRGIQQLKSKILGRRTSAPAVAEIPPGAAAVGGITKPHPSQQFRSASVSTPAHSRETASLWQLLDERLYHRGGGGKNFLVEDVMGYLQIKTINLPCSACGVIVALDYGLDFELRDEVFCWACKESLRLKSVKMSWRQKPVRLIEPFNSGKYRILDLIAISSHKAIFICEKMDLANDRLDKFHLGMCNIEERNKEALGVLLISLKNNIDMDWRETDRKAKLFPYGEHQIALVTQGKVIIFNLSNLKPEVFSVTTTTETALSWRNDTTFWDSIHLIHNTLFRYQYCVGEEVGTDYSQAVAVGKIETNREDTWERLGEVNFKILAGRIVRIIRSIIGDGIFAWDTTTAPDRPKLVMHKATQYYFNEKLEITSLLKINAEDIVVGDRKGEIIIWANSGALKAKFALKPGFPKKAWQVTSLQRFANGRIVALYQAVNPQNRNQASQTKIIILTSKLEFEEEIFSYNHPTLIGTQRSLLVLPSGIIFTLSKPEGDELVVLTAQRA